MFELKSFPPEKDSTSPEKRSTIFRRFVFKSDFFPDKLWKPISPGKIFHPQKMIKLLQETKKKIWAKNLLSRFRDFDKRSVFSAALYQELASEANQFIPVESILKSEANIGLLGQEDECECLNVFFFMRAHGVIHDACGRAYKEFGVGGGYCYALENSTAFMKSSPFLGHISGIVFCIWNRKKLQEIFESG